MIFVTVGTELPFDRLVRAVDRWAAERRRDDVFAQIGEGAPWRPSHIGYRHFLEPPEFARRFSSASAIVSHAGMGTILSALRHAKPIVIMPRQASLGEHRNDHQLATARQLSQTGRVAVALDEQALWAQMDRLAELPTTEPIGEFASADLLAGIRRFILGGTSHLPAGNH